MADRETLDVYDREAARYDNTVKLSDAHADLDVFLSRIRDQSLILDLGCGPGTTSRYMMDQGYRVDAIDGSLEMVRLAQSKGVSARQASFEDVAAEIASGPGRYGGIWASFSLLHVRRDKFPDLLKEICAGLEEGGVLYLALKLGEGEQRDELGRWYAYYSISEIEHVLNASGFSMEILREDESPGLSGEISPWVSLVAQARTC